MTDDGVTAVWCWFAKCPAASDLRVLDEGALQKLLSVHPALRDLMEEPYNKHEVDASQAQRVPDEEVDQSNADEPWWEEAEYYDDDIP